MGINIVGTPSSDPKELFFTADEVVNHVKTKLQPIKTDIYSKDSTCTIPFVSNITDIAKFLMLKGQKIQAIKLIKTCFPIGLKEAKDFVEANFVLGLRDPDKFV